MQTAINKAYFPEMQGEHVDIAKLSEGVKKSTADKGTLNVLHFSDVERSDLPVLIMDLMYVEKALKPAMPDLRLLGSLGIDVIRNYTVLSDYTAGEIILAPQQVFENQTKIPMSCEKLPIIEVEAADRKCHFALDTGANTCLLVQSFQDEPQLITVSERPDIVNIPAVCVGENEYKSINAVISDISAIQKRVLADGVIGYQVLSMQRSILDFKNNQLIMEKVQDNEACDIIEKVNYKKVSDGCLWC